MKSSATNRRAVQKAVIRDKNGSKYDLFVDEEEDGYSLLVFHRRRLAGQVNCVIQESGVLWLGNIFVEDSAVLNKGCLLWFVPWALWEKLTAKCYRERGLGSALLQYIIEYARGRGLKRIHGSVVHGDLIVTPWLLEWYRKQGFDVIPNEDREGTTVAWIRQDL